MTDAEIRLLLCDLVELALPDAPADRVRAARSGLEFFRRHPGARVRVRDYTRFRLSVRPYGWPVPLVDALHHLSVWRFRPAPLALACLRACVGPLAEPTANRLTLAILEGADCWGPLADAIEEAGVILPSRRPAPPADPGRTEEPTRVRR